MKEKKTECIPTHLQHAQGTAGARVRSQWSANCNCAPPRAFAWHSTPTAHTGSPHCCQAAGDPSRAANQKKKACVRNRQAGLQTCPTLGPYHRVSQSMGLQAQQWEMFQMLIANCVELELLWHLDERKALDIKDVQKKKFNPVFHRMSKWFGSDTHA